MLGYAGALHYLPFGRILERAHNVIMKGCVACMCAGELDDFDFDAWFHDDLNTKTQHVSATQGHQGAASTMQGLLAAGTAGMLQLQPHEDWDMLHHLKQWLESGLISWCTGGPAHQPSKAAF